MMPMGGVLGAAMAFGSATEFQTASDPHVRGVMCFVIVSICSNVRENYIPVAQSFQHSAQLRLVLNIASIAETRFEWSVANGDLFLNRALITETRFE
jgi:hypothetical protein